MPRQQDKRGTEAAGSCPSSLISVWFAACQAIRNKHHTKANWQFTAHRARVKRKRLYLSL
jgi:hypothetical protein